MVQAKHQLIAQFVQHLHLDVVGGLQQRQQIDRGGFDIIDLAADQGVDRGVVVLDRNPFDGVDINHLAAGTPGLPARER